MERLRRRRDFERVFATELIVHGRAVVVRYRARDGDGAARVGVTAGKRLDKRAVKRNRARRRLREAIRPLSLADGYDAVALARAPALTLAFDALAADVRLTFRRAGLLA